MSSRRYFCTLADRNYLVRGLALIESLQRHERGDYTLYFVCLDELTRVVLTALDHPNVVPVPLHAIEAGDEALAAARANRTFVEYYWTLTPSIIRWLIQHYPAIDVLTYLDADLYFFSPSDPVYAELGSRSILIHEHRFTPDLAYMVAQSGRFNVGLLSFRRDADGMGALEWWRDRCNEWCYQRVESGKFGDQMYLDDWPTRFRNVVVLQNVGAGLAPWNVGNYRISAENGKTPTVDGGPVVFYHFHSLQVPRPDVVLTSKHSGFPLVEQLLRGCYVPYAEALWRQGMAVKAVLPTFAFGMNEKISITPGHTLLVRQSPQNVDIGIGSYRRFPFPGGWEARWAVLPEEARQRAAHP
ncbi:MAG TPA: glycosyl transferase [Polyangia bacterium]|nr:glycosyl transferase [Polyangia bacterium]